MNSIGYFEIQSSFPAREMDFYQKVFGWKFIKEDLTPVEYYRIENAGMNGGLLKRPAAVPSTEQGTNAFTCSIQVDNFDSTAQKILSQGGIVALPKFAVPGRCWQGYFLDPEGNTFGIFQPDPQAK